jgi:hypothetical protein
MRLKTQDTRHKIVCAIAFFLMATVTMAQDGAPQYTSGPSTGVRSYGADSSAALKVRNYGVGGACVELTTANDTTFLNTELDTTSLSSGKNIALMPKRGSGYVGIGTTNPLGKLHINSLAPDTLGTERMLYVTDSAGRDHFNIWRVSDGRTLTLFGNSDQSGSGFQIQARDGFYPLASGTFAAFSLISDGITGTVSNFDFGDDVIALQADGGNVGIGTDAPGANLHVDGNTIFDGDVYGTGSSFGYTGFGSGDTTTFDVSYLGLYFDMGVQSAGGSGGRIHLRNKQPAADDLFEMLSGIQLSSFNESLTYGSFVNVNPNSVSVSHADTVNSTSSYFEATASGFFLLSNKSHLVLQDESSLAGAGAFNVGIGTNNPTSKLTVGDGDVYITDVASGVVIPSPDGTCWRLTPDNSGNTVWTSITCP